MRTLAASTLLFLVVLAACTVGATAPGATANAVHGSAVAGPTCPVERPGDSGCAPRPVTGATIVIQRSSGAEVGRVTTSADGSFSVALPAGSYTFVAQPVPGLMGTAQPMSVTVAADGSTVPALILVRYDTGIR